MITEMNHSDSSNVVDPKMRRSPTTVCHPSRTPHLHTISLIRVHPRKLRDHHNKTTPASIILLGRLMDATDSELVERYRNGDVRAFETLVHRYERQIFTFLLRYVGDREAAEDLVQDTFTQVIEKLQSYEERGRFGSWLFRLANSLAVDEWRKRERRPEDLSEIALEHAIDPGQRPGMSLEQEDIRREVYLALGRLPEPQRKVFLLRQHSDLKFREIADITGEPLNTVLSHMRYATTRLRQELRFLRDDEEDSE